MIEICKALLCENIDAVNRNGFCKISNQKCIRIIADDMDICAYFKEIPNAVEILKKG